MPDIAVRRGPLIFKGVKEAAHSSAKNLPVKKASIEKKLNQQKELKQDGRIVSFGTTVQGMETRFKDEIQIGDLVIIRHPQTLAIEERIVTSVMSQRSLSIHDPFSSDLVSTTEFSIRKESIVVQKSESIKKEGTEELFDEPAENEPNINDELTKRLSQAKSTLSYQDKLGAWNRKTVTVQLDAHYSQEELLDMRCKKVHDKYC